MKNTFSKFKIYLSQILSHEFSWFFGIISSAYIFTGYATTKQSAGEAIIHARLTHVRHNSPICRHLLWNFQKTRKISFLDSSLLYESCFRSKILLYQFVLHHYMIIKFPFYRSSSGLYHTYLR